MKSRIQLVLAIILLAGCSDSIQTTSAIDLAQTVDGQDGTIICYNDTQYAAYEMHVIHDSITFRLLGTPIEPAVPFTQIRSVQVSDQLGGGLIGALVGSCASGTVAMLGLALSHSGPQGEGGLDISPDIAKGIFVGGTVVGFLVGWDRGIINTIYLPPQDTTVRSTIPGVAP